MGKGSGPWQGQGGPGRSGVRGAVVPSLAWDPEWGQEASKRAQALLLSLRFHGDPRAVGDRCLVGEQGRRLLATLS